MSVELIVSYLLDGGAIQNLCLNSTEIHYVTPEGNPQIICNNTELDELFEVKFDDNLDETSARVDLNDGIIYVHSYQDDEV